MSMNLQLLCNMNQIPPVPPPLVAPMRNVVSKMAQVLALVYLNTLEIHTKDVGQNAF